MRTLPKHIGSGSGRFKTPWCFSCAKVEKGFRNRIERRQSKGVVRQELEEIVETSVNGKKPVRLKDAHQRIEFQSSELAWLNYKLGVLKKWIEDSGLISTEQAWIDANWASEGFDGKRFGIAHERLKALGLRK